MSEVAESTTEIAASTVVDDLTAKVGADRCVVQETADKIPTIWVPREEIQSVLRYLKDEVSAPYELLFDVSAIDERTRQHRVDQPDSDFTVFYHLISLSGNNDIRIKVPLSEGDNRVKSVSSIYPVANWYEREAFDMFGIDFEDHPNLRRILTPPLWEGHPLRKEHPARATEMDPFKMTPEFQKAQQDALLSLIHI